MTTKHVVTDEDEKKFQDRLWELENRWRKKILDPEQTLLGLQSLIENRRARVVRAGDFPPFLTDWQSFYRDLGISCDLSGVIIPDDPGELKRILIMAQGITPQSGYDLCAKNFPCWKYTKKNLDDIVISERTTKNGAYAIRVRDRVEADEELKNLSVYNLKQRDILGITLEEREIYGLKFFKEAGKHLDIQNWTLCSGSRCGDGYVLGAYWSGGEFKVDCSHPVNSGDRLRSRQVVS